MSIGYILKVLLVPMLISALIVGFIGFIAYAIEHSEKCTCEMVKNHECQKD